MDVILYAKSRPIIGAISPNLSAFVKYVTFPVVTVPVKLLLIAVFVTLQFTSTIVAHISLHIALHATQLVWDVMGLSQLTVQDVKITFSTMQNLKKMRQIVLINALFPYSPKEKNVSQ